MLTGRPYTCAHCGITFTAIMDHYLCARCQKSPATERHPLADAPPMPSREIEAIKVACLRTGWTWEQN